MFSNAGHSLPPLTVNSRATNFTLAFLLCLPALRADPIPTNLLEPIITVIIPLNKKKNLNLPNPINSLLLLLLLFAIVAILLLSLPLSQFYSRLLRTAIPD
jgi:hypothetical protein